jgi:hypothetical protein
MILKAQIFGSCWLSGGRGHHGVYEGRHNPFQIVATLKHRDVTRQKPLTEATEQAQEIAAAGPNAFHGIVMDFANTITIIIARPLAAPWRMANRLVRTACGSKVLIRRPFIGVDDRAGARMSDHEWFQRGPISPFTEAQADRGTAPPDDSDNRRTIAGPSSVAARLVGPTMRRVSRISVFAAFLASILIEFIGFRHWVGQGCSRGKMRCHQCVSGVVVRAGGFDC